MYFTRYCRSVLFTSASHPHRFGKAGSYGADICLVDCEDSVSRDAKEQARHLAATFFPPAAQRTTRLAIRVNALTDEHGLADLLAIRQWRHQPDIILIPKVESPRDIEIVRAIVGDRIELMALIETARGVQAVTAIARASPALRALVFGSADFAMAINSSRGWEALYPSRAQIVLAARAAGIHAIDTPAFDIDNLESLAGEARRARDMGFSGKVAIHPRQVPVINEAYSPGTEALAHAQRIVTEADANGGNVCVVDGMMVGAPIVAAARRTLAEFVDAGGRGATSGG